MNLSRVSLAKKSLNKKIVVNCRNFSMMLTSILRSKGIPARCRCGFAIYFEKGWFEDHWVTEYWNKKENIPFYSYI